MAKSCSGFTPSPSPLLAARLKHLEREGLAHKITLPAPARTPAYALTEAGEELGPAILELARWGLKWAMGERRVSETFHPGWAVLGLRACFDTEAAAGLHAVYEFCCWPGRSRLRWRGSRTQP
ncbi:winged helix-turn-helix transcriptional regulator [Streptomyces djakartensis]|uniref:winged helix-turn-helix transcriptional regulator n=1 Tax=Streptomyces djakartensis TaxID=68193 RepID=UPI0027E3EF5E|nr:winged helix-turn-helix transcriptional regulator [Streptomyces djakartensis]